MEPQWRNYLNITVDCRNVEDTTIGYAILDNGGKITKLGARLCIISLNNLNVELLDEETTKQRISHDGHLRLFDVTVLKTCYRLTLADGQRLIYVQCADIFESFIQQDSHASFDAERK